MSAYNISSTLPAGLRVIIKSAPGKKVELDGQEAMIVESPVHPNTWYSVKASDGQVVKLRRTSIQLPEEAAAAAQQQQQQQSSQASSRASHSHSASSSGSGSERASSSGTKWHSRKAAAPASQDSEAFPGSVFPYGSMAASAGTAAPQSSADAVAMHLIGQFVYITHGKLVGQTGLVVGYQNGSFRVRTEAEEVVKKPEQLEFANIASSPMFLMPQLNQLSQLNQLGLSTLAGVSGLGAMSNMSNMAGLAGLSSLAGMGAGMAGMTGLGGMQNMAAAGLTGLGGMPLVPTMSTLSAQQQQALQPALGVGPGSASLTTAATGAGAAPAGAEPPAQAQPVPAATVASGNDAAVQLSAEDHAKLAQLLQAHQAAQAQVQAQAQAQAEPMADVKPVVAVAPAAPAAAGSEAVGSTPAAAPGSEAKQSAGGESEESSQRAVKRARLDEAGTAVDTAVPAPSVPAMLTPAPATPAPGTPALAAVTTPAEGQPVTGQKRTADEAFADHAPVLALSSSTPNTAADPTAATGTASGADEGKKKRLAQSSGLSRLTDPSLYPGAHKHRFDGDGRGRGMAGRDSLSKGGGGAAVPYSGGAVSDLSQITRSNLRPAAPPPRAAVRSSPVSAPRSAASSSPVAARPVARSSPSVGAGAGAGAGSSPKKASPAKGLSRLTDPSMYPGAHKHRFGADGRGRGLDGRDSVTKGGGGVGVYRGGAVSDLSQLVTRR